MQNESQGNWYAALRIEDYRVVFHEEDILMQASSNSPR